jgi:CRISPR/Cas system-associated exonuclease Cas4 (RecB family)
MAGMSQDHPSDQGHWYYPDGRTAYTIIGKNGVERPTTLRDAKKLGLRPSVTTIIKEANKPGLNNWIQDQTILSCLTMPRIEGEAEKDYIERLKKDANEQAQKAAKKGTQIHAWVQEGFEGHLTEEGMPFFLAARHILKKSLGIEDWICEESFATDRYGGKVDLHSKAPAIVVDIKSKDSPVEGLRIYDEHAMQVAAYMKGLKLDHGRGFILYINYQAETNPIELTPTELDKGLEMFNALTDYFYARTGLSN